MTFNLIKKCAKSLGLYRTARRVHRHTMARDQLRTIKEELVFFSDLLGQDDLCFDVGANYGAKTEVFLRLGAKVVSFEPQKDCIEELQSRLGANPRLVTVNSALGSGSGVSTMHVERNRTASSLIKDWQGEVIDTIEVTVTTLDDAIAQFGVPRYCKIDVEGYELEVLRGLSQPIPTLSFEYHFRGDGVARSIACLEYLSNFGELAINVTPAEKAVFVGDQWRDKDSFIEFFRHERSRLSDYGDIFVKTKMPRKA